MQTLYLVATPIGNIEDITLRAMRVIKDSDYLLCEDTRKTGLLLQRLNLKTNQKLLSYYEENENQRILQVINLLKNNYSVALVSNAGTPTVSDPGFKLVRECYQQGIKVESIPGPCSIISALVSSGLPTNNFIFGGFLPKKEGQRIKFLKNYQSLSFQTTLIFFESPYRLVKSLEAIKAVFGDIQIVIANDLTKKFERIDRDLISNLIDQFQLTKVKGEIIILFQSS